MLRYSRVYCFYLEWILCVILDSWWMVIVDDDGGGVGESNSSPQQPDRR